MLPVVNQSIHAKRGMKTFVDIGTGFPDPYLLSAKRIVGHHHVAYTRQIQDHVDMFREIPRSKEGSGLGEVGSTCVKTESIKHRNDTASRFG